MLQSRTLCEKAIGLDPQFAPPYAELAHTYYREVAERWNVSERRETLAKGLAMATRALALDPALSTAHMIMGMLLSRLGDYEEAAASGQKAIDLNPNAPESYVALGNLLYYTNRSRDAVTLFEKARSLDPFHPPIFDYFLGRCYLGHGDLVTRSLISALSCGERRTFGLHWPSSLLPTRTQATWMRRDPLSPKWSLVPVGSLSRFKQEGDYQPGRSRNTFMKAFVWRGSPNDPHPPPRSHHGR